MTPDLSRLTLPELLALGVRVRARLNRFPDPAEELSMTVRYSKSDLIKFIAAERSLLDRGRVQTVVDAVFEAITTLTERGDTVAIAGFGVFAPKVRGARTGRNPRTGEPVEIAASTTLGFRPSKPAKAK